MGLSFGFTACPYYCSAWSAEFRRWVVDYAHMVDDWLLVGIDLANIKEKCAALAAMFESVGFSMQPAKNIYDTSVR